MDVEPPALYAVIASQQDAGNGPGNEKNEPIKSIVEFLRRNEFLDGEGAPGLACSHLPSVGCVVLEQNSGVPQPTFVTELPELEDEKLTTVSARLQDAARRDACQKTPGGKAHLLFAVRHSRTSKPQRIMGEPPARSPALMVRTSRANSRGKASIFVPSTVLEFTPRHSAGMTTHWRFRSFN
jgi:hypothetical protein